MDGSLWKMAVMRFGLPTKFSLNVVFPSQGKRSWCVASSNVIDTIYLSYSGIECNILWFSLLLVKMLINHLLCSQVVMNNLTKQCMDVKTSHIDITMITSHSCFEKINAGKTRYLISILSSVTFVARGYYHIFNTVCMWNLSISFYYQTSKYDNLFWLSQCVRANITLECTICLFQDKWRSSQVNF